MLMVKQKSLQIFSNLYSSIHPQMLHFFQDLVEPFESNDQIQMYVLATEAFFEWSVLAVWHSRGSLTWYLPTIWRVLRVKKYIYIYGCFQKIGVPQNGWFIMENPNKMYDLGGKTPIFGNTQRYSCLNGNVLCSWSTKGKLPCSKCSKLLSGWQRRSVGNCVSFPARVCFFSGT